MVHSTGVLNACRYIFYYLISVQIPAHLPIQANKDRMLDVKEVADRTKRWISPDFPLVPGGWGVPQGQYQARTKLGFQSIRWIRMNRICVNDKKEAKPGKSELELIKSYPTWPTCETNYACGVLSRPPQQFTAKIEQMKMVVNSSSRMTAPWIVHPAWMRIEVTV